MSVFTTLIYGDDSNKPIANFTTTSLKDAASLVNAYLGTLTNVDVSKDYVVKQYASPMTISNQQPPRVDGRDSVPIVTFTYNNEGPPSMKYLVSTTIHGTGCSCPVHKHQISA
jgi:hypothetical protein